MTKSKKIKIDYFYVDAGTRGTKTLRDYIKTIPQLGYDKKLWKWYDDYFRMDNLRFEEGSFSGEFLRIKPGEAARIIHLEREGVHDMELPQDAYMGGGLPFMYFEESGVLVMQRSRNMANHWRIAEYIRNVTGIPYLILEAVNKDNRQLSSFEKIYRFEFCTALPRARGRKASDIGVGDALSILDAYQGQTINISISANRGKERVPLNRELVISTIERAGLMGMHPRKSKVTGRIDSLENEVLDLLRDTLEYETTIDFSGKEPLPSEVAPVLKKAYDKFRNKLFKQVHTQDD